MLPRDPGSGEEDRSDTSSENSIAEAPIEISDVEAETEEIPAASSLESCHQRQAHWSIGPEHLPFVPGQIVRVESRC